MKKWQYYHHKLLNFITREKNVLETHGNGRPYMEGRMDTLNEIYMEMKHILDDLAEGKHEH